MIERVYLFHLAPFAVRVSNSIDEPLYLSIAVKVRFKRQHLAQHVRLYERQLPLECQMCANALCAPHTTTTSMSFRFPVDPGEVLYNPPRCVMSHLRTTYRIALGTAICIRRA